MTEKKKGSDLVWCIKHARNIYVFVNLNSDLCVKMKITKAEALYQASLIDDETKIEYGWSDGTPDDLWIGA